MELLYSGDDVQNCRDLNPFMNLSLRYFGWTKRILTEERKKYKNFLWTILSFTSKSYSVVSVAFRVANKNK